MAPPQRFPVCRAIRKPRGCVLPRKHRHGRLQAAEQAAVDHPGRCAKPATCLATMRGRGASPGVRNARSRTASWRDEYNFSRPHDLFGDQSPAGFAAACAAFRCGPGLGSGRPRSFLWSNPFVNPHVTCSRKSHRVITHMVPGFFGLLSRLKIRCPNDRGRLDATDSRCWRRPCRSCLPASQP